MAIAAPRCGSLASGCWAAGKQLPHGWKLPLGPQLGTARLAGTAGMDLERQHVQELSHIRKSHSALGLLQGGRTWLLKAPGWANYPLACELAALLDGATLYVAELGL